MSYNLTLEQNQVISLANTGQNMKVVAFAGAAKTTTLTEIAKTMSDKKVLYLAFNKAVAKEAKGKLPTHAQSSTFHALALSKLDPAYRAKLFSNKKTLSYHAECDRTNARSGQGKVLMPLLNPEHRQSWLTPSQAPYITYDDKAYPAYLQYISPKDMLQLIQSTLGVFYRSADESISHTHADIAWFKKYGFYASKCEHISSYLDLLKDGATNLWEDAKDLNNQNAVHLPHDFYLKLWQLSKPLIDADVILFDEAQDADPLMLDILQRQQCQVIYVGDSCQQIYSWRGAVNAIESIQAPQMHLTTSFRFGANIANIANQILSFLREHKQVKGFQPKDEVCIVDEFLSDVPMLQSTQAILTRTNTGAFEVALQLMERNLPFRIQMDITTIENRLKHIQEILSRGYETLEREIITEEWKEEVMAYKNGRGPKPAIPDLPYATKPACLDSVFLSRNIKDVADLELYTYANPGCTEVSRYYEWIKRYGYAQLIAILDNSRTQKTGITISTIHKSKGLQWPTVYIHNDITSYLNRTSEFNKSLLSNHKEEFHLFYVAVTRAQSVLYLPLEMELLLEQMKAQKHI